MFEMVAFDADDTLWHNETIFALTQEKFARLLAPYQGRAWTGQELYETETRNLHYFGYGIKGFVLSMIETAIQLTDGRVTGSDIQKIIDLGKEMLGSPVELLEHVGEIVPRLAQDYKLMLITKGDVFDQESKIAKSGLAEYFTAIEIVGDKTEDVYRALLKKHGIDPGRFVMVGNSLRSDILPVVALGGTAIHIPYHVTWQHEMVSREIAQTAQYLELEDIGKLPALLARLSRD